MNKLPADSMLFPMRRVKEKMRKYQSLIVVLLTTFFLTQTAFYKVLAQKAGFGDAIDQVKGNAIITSAGTEAQDAILFPFIIVGVIFLLALLALGVISIVALFNGRDIATPIINLAGAFAIILMINAMIIWVLASGMLGTTTAGAGG